MYKTYTNMMYSIKAVTSLTGLNAETLRAWERRYRAVVPVRDKNGRRTYSSQDIQRLTLLQNAREGGHAISKLAILDDTELQALLNKAEQSSVSVNELIFSQIKEALMQYRLDRCEELLRHALIAMEPLKYANEFLMPLLHKVGDLWHEGAISIAQEHMFSNCIKRIVLSMVNNMMPFSGNQAKLLFCTPRGEQHEFGILLSCLVAANQRCACYYLGANLPLQELILAQNNLNCDIIILSLVNTPVEPALLIQLEQLFIETSAKTEIWIGGEGAASLYQNQLHQHQFQLINNLKDFDKKLKIINLRTQ